MAPLNEIINDNSNNNTNGDSIAFEDVMTMLNGISPRFKAVLLYLDKVSQIYLKYDTCHWHFP